jgi:AraC-like DNA-binding protein
LAAKFIDDDVHGAILRRGDPMNNVLSAYLNSLVAEWPALTLSHAPRVAQAAASLVAAAFGAQSAARRPVANDQRACIRRMIEDELGDPAFGADRIMERFAISRTPLYKMFEPLGGVRSYIQERRLHRVLRSLAAPEFAGRKIGDIAASCGFSSRSTFNRSFRDVFGMSPVRIRAAALEGDGCAFGASVEPGGAGVFTTPWAAQTGAPGSRAPA